MLKHTQQTTSHNGTQWNTPIPLLDDLTICTYYYIVPLLATHYTNVGV